MAEIVNLKKRVENSDFNKRIEDWELEEVIHQQFLKRQDLMWKHPIWDERITRIDTWLLQHKPPLEILIAILSRATFCGCGLYDEATPEQKRLMLLSLKLSYQEFQKLPERWQEALWSVGFGGWHLTFLEEEEAEAKKAHA